MNELDDLIERLRRLAPLAKKPATIWNTVVGHPWMMGQFTRAARRVARNCDSLVTRDDLIHDAMIDLSRRNLRGLDLSRSRGEIASYLRRLVGWEVRGAAQRAWGANGTKSLESAPEPAMHPDDTLVWGELIDRLPPLQQRIVELRLEGYTLQEIADRMDLPLSTTYGHYRRAREAVGAAVEV